MGRTDGSQTWHLSQLQLIQNASTNFPVHRKVSSVCGNTVQRCYGRRMESCWSARLMRGCRSCAAIEAPKHDASSTKKCEKKMISQFSSTIKLAKKNTVQFARIIWIQYNKISKLVSVAKINKAIRQSFKHQGVQQPSVQSVGYNQLELSCHRLHMFASRIASLVLFSTCKPLAAGEEQTNKT